MQTPALSSPQHFHHPQKKPVPIKPWPILPFPHPWQLLTCFLSLWIGPCWIFHLNGITQRVTVCSGFFTLAFSCVTHVPWHVSKLHGSSQLNNSPLCGYRTFGLSSHRLMDSLLFPPFDCCEQCCCEHACTSFCLNTCSQVSKYI